MIRTYSNEELLKLMGAAPPPVQQAIESKITAKVILGIGTRLGLHIDVIGKIAVLDTQMLLGLVNPQEFLQELLSAGVSDANARLIMEEINQKIFLPVREEVRKGLQGQAAPQNVAAPEIPVPGSNSNFRLENKIPVPQRPPAPQVPRGAIHNTRLADAVAKALDSGHLLEDHEEPHIDFKKPDSSAPAPAAMRPTSPPMPRAMSNPQPTPGSIAPRIIPPGARAPMSGPRPLAPTPAIPPPPYMEPKPVAGPVAPKPPAAPTPAAPSASPSAPKPYSADPYREPIDETDL